MNDGADDYYYVHDHLYSPAALLDDDGSVLERYEYDVYGYPHIMNASYEPRETSDYSNPYMFTGRRVDILDSNSLTLQYNRNRYYDYYTGRWLTDDPLGITPNPRMLNEFAPVGQYRDGMSLYEYVNSNPMVNSDPMGLIPPVPVHWWPPDPWCRPSPPPKNHATAYDWWDLKRSPEGFIACIKPCRWRNNGRVKYRIYSGGCYDASPSLPLAPGCGPTLAIAGILFEATSPSVELCNGHLVEKFKCQCRMPIWRRCKSKCCDLEHGVWTSKKKIRKTLIGYGRTVRKWGSLYCSCDPRLWLGGHSLADILDDEFVCK